MSKTIDNGGSAFGHAVVSVDGNGQPLTPTEAHALGLGLTIRDWFAGQALAGMMAMNSSHNGNFHDNCGEPFTGPAGYAYRMADAMIAARKAVGQ